MAKKKKWLKFRHKVITAVAGFFFGPVVNAARGVSAQVGSAVNNFSMNFYTAFRPQIVKSYSGKDYDYFIKCYPKYNWYKVRGIDNTRLETVIPEYWELCWDDKEICSSYEKDAKLVLGDIGEK